MMPQEREERAGRLKEIRERLDSIAAEYGRDFPAVTGGVGRTVFVTVDDLIRNTASAAPDEDLLTFYLESFEKKKERAREAFHEHVKGYHHATAWYMTAMHTIALFPSMLKGVFQSLTPSGDVDPAPFLEPTPGERYFANTGMTPGQREIVARAAAVRRKIGNAAAAQIGQEIYDSSGPFREGQIVRLQAQYDDLAQRYVHEAIMNSNGNNR